MINTLTKINSFRELGQEVINYITSDSLHKTIGLSGGATIPPVLDSLGTSIFLSDKNHWTWIDERLVPYEEEGSNYGLVSSYFVQKNMCFPLPCEDNETAKNLYQKKLIINQGLPQLDLLLLGFGADGHIASLFPNSEQLDRPCFAEDWVFRSQASYEPKERWTWGMEALTKTKKTFIIFKGDNNSDKFHRFHEANTDENCDTPLARFMKKNKNHMCAFQILV